MALNITSAKIKANKVKIDDTADHYSSTEVEGALQESGTLLDNALYGTSAELSEPVPTPADSVSVTDVGNYYVGSDVEAVLQEIGLDLNTSMSYKGSVSDSAHLPASNQSIGDMYYVVDITTTYLWSGIGWIAVGGGQMTATNVSITDSGDYYTSTNVEGALQEIYTDLGSAAYAYIGTLEGNIPALVAGGKLDTAVLPAIAITNTSVVASQSAMLELIAQVGDVAVRSDLNKSFILTVEPATTLTNWQELLTPTDAVLSVNGKTNVVVLNATDVGLGNVTNESKATMFTSPTFTGTVSGITKAMVGLGNVDNTSDVNKPISNATQTALDGKLSLTGGTLTGLLTTNGQIKFPATQNPSSDANTLDDYEEGTWTPGTTTWTVQPSFKLGRYVKIGKLVTINITIKGGAFSTDQFITGLPFPISADSGIAYIEQFYATTPIVIGIFAGGFPYQISYSPGYNAGSGWWLVQGTYESN
jgi:hypothetical protein